MEAPVEIDGGMLEGGGQILRVSAALSVIMRTPIHITKIRSRRSKPGLRSQHLKGLEIVQTICQGRLKGAVPDSTEVTLFPGPPRGGHYEADTHTAGSITLLVQVSLPCALFGNGSSVMKFRGGTNTEMAPHLDYMTEVFRPLLERFGASFDYKLIRRGYFPRGGGELHIRVHPVRHLDPVVMLEPGTVKRIWGWAFVAGNLPAKVAHIMADGATRMLQATFGNIEINIDSYKESSENSVGTASGINLVAQTTTGFLLGGSALGKRDQEASETGQLAARQVIEEILGGVCVDRHAQDQIILFMALANGISEVRVGRITEHTQTVMHVCETLTEAKFSIITISLNPEINIIRCYGIGFRNRNLR